MTVFVRYFLSNQILKKVIPVFLNQMLDMIRPATKNQITLKDLKRCKMTPVFFDTFFNLEKYLDHEQRDPFATQREVDEDGNEVIIDQIRGSKNWKLIKHF